MGSDAGNIRVDAAAQRVYVGHSAGAIAVIDAASQKIVNDIRLKDHPEGFQLDPAGRLIWVNIPDHREIGVLDRTSGPTDRELADDAVGRKFFDGPAIESAAARARFSTSGPIGCVQCQDRPGT